MSYKGDTYLLQNNDTYFEKKRGTQFAFLLAGFQIIATFQRSAVLDDAWMISVPCGIVYLICYDLIFFSNFCIYKFISFLLCLS